MDLNCRDNLSALDNYSLSTLLSQRFDSWGLHSRHSSSAGNQQYYDIQFINIYPWLLSSSDNCIYERDSTRNLRNSLADNHISCSWNYNFLCPCASHFIRVTWDLHSNSRRYLKKHRKRLVFSFWFDFSNKFFVEMLILWMEK